MSILKKMKDMLFEEEEYTEPIQIRQEEKKVKEEPQIVKIEPEVNYHEEIVKQEPVVEIKKEPEIKEIIKPHNTFQFPDFDEEEFASNMSRQRENNNVLEYEKKKTIEKRTDYGRFEKIETREYTERKKFKPSPIISPVYGILNQDYRAEDIIDRTDNASNIDIDIVRKKAFEKKEEYKDTIDEPVVTFFEEKEEIKEKVVPEEKKVEDDFKTIDDLLEEASTEITLEDTLEIPKTNNLDAIEEELEKLDVEEEHNEIDNDSDEDSDLFELIDSMYEDREEV